jgi:hypothetical protein
MGPALEKQDRAFPDSLPTEQIPDDSYEATTFSTVVLYRSVLNDIPLILFLLSVSICFRWITSIIRTNINGDFGQQLASMLAYAPLVSIIFLFGIIAFKRYNVRYMIADDGIKALRGFLSNHQIDAKLEYYQIRGTEIHRSLFNRLLGTGDLHVHGSTSQVIEVAFKGIFDPYRFQKLIQARHRNEVGKSLDITPQ